MTTQQIEALCAVLGLTKTQLVIVAIDRMTRDTERGLFSTEDTGSDPGDVDDTGAILRET